MTNTTTIVASHEITSEVIPLSLSHTHTEIIKSTSPIPLSQLSPHLLVLSFLTFLSFKCWALHSQNSLQQQEGEEQVNWRGMSKPQICDPSHWMLVNLLCLCVILVLLWVDIAYKTRLMKMERKECHLKFLLFCENSNKGIPAHAV